VSPAGKRFSVAAGTPPTADETGPAESPAPPVPDGPSPAMVKALRQQHVFALDSAFGKARAALSDYEGAMAVVRVVVEAARRDGVDEDTIGSSAMRKHMQVPEDL